MTPDTDRPEIHKTGHNWLDMVVAISALFISVVSLVLAILDGRTMERTADANARLVAANSWPFLEYATGNEDDAKGLPVVTMGMTNVGVGPAKIESVELRWHGKAFHNVIDFVRACCVQHAEHLGMDYSVAQGTILRAGETVSILTLSATTENNDIYKRLNTERSNVDLNVCYCSVFDECWTSNLARYSLKPLPVETCPVPHVPLEMPR